jgi:hypothetical protein
MTISSRAWELTHPQLEQATCPLETADPQRLQ